MTLVNIVKALSVRITLLIHNIITVWRVTAVWGNDMFWLLLLANIPFIFEAIYVVWKKQGIEWKWLCPCFLFFLMSTMPGIWLLEINRQGLYAALNITIKDDVEIAGVQIPIRLNADTWVLVIEECLLYFMILGRWLLPRGDVSREQLSQLLFSFIAIASDIMELFSLFDEDVIRGDIVVTYVLLGVWTLSILQFTLVLTVYNRPKRARVVEKTTSVLLEQKEALRLEIVAIFVSLFMQDGPFLCLRLFVMLEYRIFTYTIVFFTLKNFLVILLLVYRLSILCANNYCKKRKRDEDAEAIELRNGKQILSRKAFANETYQSDKFNGGAIRQRSRPPSDGAHSSPAESTGFSSGGIPAPKAVIVEPQPVEKPKSRHTSSAAGSESVRSEDTEVESIPDGHHELESCRL